MYKNNEGGSGGGAHGDRRYEGFTDEQHQQDVTGNNALIKELTEHFEEKEKDDGSSDDEDD